MFIQVYLKTKLNSSLKNNPNTYLKHRDQARYFKSLIEELMIELIMTSIKFQKIEKEVHHSN